MIKEKRIKENEIGPAYIDIITNSKVGGCPNDWSLTNQSFAIDLSIKDNFGTVVKGGILLDYNFSIKAQISSFSGNCLLSVLFYLFITHYHHS